MIQIKNFLSKHAFLVVFIIAILIAFTNFLIYPIFISGQMKLATIPVAKGTLEEGTLITSEMMEEKTVSMDQVPEGILTQKELVVGNFVRENGRIPAGGYFFTELLSSEEATFGSSFKELREGEWAYTMVVPGRWDQNSNLNPGELIDIYFYTTEKVQREDEKGILFTKESPVFGMLAENKRIIGISDTGDNRFVTIAMEEEEISYFTLAEKLGEIYPLVYYGSSGLTEGKAECYDSSLLRAWLKEQSAAIFETDPALLEGNPAESVFIPATEEGGNN